MSVNRWLVAALGWSAIIAMMRGLPCAAAEPATSPERAASKWATPAADRAADKGLGYLISKQNEDGSFGNGYYRGNVAVVSLAGMAMIAGGSTPGRGPCGRPVAQCLDYVLAHVQESGFIVAHGFESHGPMYGHGFATMFLAECYGSSPRPEVRDRLAKAIKLTVNTQNAQGGWRYKPERMDADISVTISQVMALRAARNAGIHVPKETVDRSVDYVKKSQNPDGGFTYMLTAPGPSQFPRSAAGVVGLFCAGIYEGPEVTNGLGYLMQHLPQAGAVQRERSYYFYGHYYAALAMWQVGGERWAKWYPAIRDELVAKQRPNGSWSDSAISAEFDTAMACLILQVPNNYLPIFQR